MDVAEWRAAPAAVERQARGEEILFEQDVVADPAAKREPRGAVVRVLDHLNRQIGVVGEEVDRRATEQAAADRFGEVA